MESQTIENSNFSDNNAISDIAQNVTMQGPFLPDVPIHQLADYSQTAIYIFLIMFFLFISVLAIMQWNIVTFVWFALVTGLWIPILIYCSIKIGINMFQNSTCYSNCINVNTEPDIERNVQ